MNAPPEVSRIILEIITQGLLRIRASAWADRERCAIEADHLLSAPASELSRRDRIRKMAGPAPFLVFAYVLFWKGCIWGGRRGWYYALQRLFAEIILALELNDRRLNNSKASGGKAPGQAQ